MRPVLDSFADSMMQNPSTMIVIVGHTDDSGNDAIKKPSLRRQYLQHTRLYSPVGCPPSNRFSIEGHGSYEPIAANNSAKNRAQNRRVEIFVFEK